jgi:hypothetical protein
MHFNFYDNKLLASAKCGSRYLDSIYGIPDGIKQTFPSTTILSKVIHHLSPFSKLNLNGIKWVVIRPPMDLLITAVHTELILHWTKNREKNSEKDIIHNLTFSDWMCAHYQFNLYKEMFLKSIDYPDIKFVKLEDLSMFCESELNLHKPYKPSNFDFNGLKGDFNIDKNMTMDYLKLVYPYYYSTLIKNIPIDEFFYNLIIDSKKLWKVENKEDYQKRYKNFL